MRSCETPYILSELASGFNILFRAEMSETLGKADSTRSGRGPGEAEFCASVEKACC